jgi:arylsulfatase A-like enzyme
MKLMSIRGMWAHLAGAIPLSKDDYLLMRELYTAEVALADEFVGQIIDALGRAGVIDETLVIITSDHGENIGDHGMIDHLLSMHDTTLRVPLIMRYPPRFAPGSTVPGLVSLVDVFETILDVCGLEPAAQAADPQRASLCDPDWTGRDFVVAENDRPVNGVRLLKKRFPSFDTSRIDYPMRMIRTQQHKLIWHVNRKVELYDLEADAGETADVSRKDTRMREDLLDMLTSSMRRIEKDGDVAPFESGDTESIRRLRSLGYVP